MSSKKRIFLYLLAIIFVGCALRIPSLLVNFVNIDENEVVLAAKILTQGGLPYRDYMIYQPPLLYYFYALVMVLIPTPELSDSIWWVHVATFFVVAGTCIAIYFTAKSVFDDQRKGLFAALFFAIFSTTYLPQDMLAANIELIMILPMTLCVCFFVREKYFLAGLFMGLVLLSKYQGAVLLPALGLYLLIKKRGSAVFPMTVLLIATALVCASWAYYLYAKGAWSYAVQCFQYILHYAKGPQQNDWLYITLKLLLRTTLIGIAGFGLWAFALKGFRKSFHCPEFLFVLWIVFGFLAIIAGGRMYFHYYLIIYPPLAILAGAQAVDFFERLKHLPFEKTVWRVTIFILMFSLPVTGFTAYATYKPFRIKSPKDYWIYVVDYIRDRSAPTDSVLVWGYCPQIYVASNRNMATRFTTSDYLTGRTPKTAGLEYDPKTLNPPSVWKKLLGDFKTPSQVIDYDTSDNIFPVAWELFSQDLSNNKPELIIDTSPSNYRMYGRYPMSKFPVLDEYVHKNYVFEASIRGMDIYRKKSSVVRNQSSEKKQR
ncbi:MAG: glycosyltransferase family 39 protein [Deltaproteobacteria bacterium]|nr:glycosyltransferase family 39 protein [Deltaproteobacteria bacterium]